MAIRTLVLARKERTMEGVRTFSSRLPVVLAVGALTLAANLAAVSASVRSPDAGTISVRPTSGPAGTHVGVKGFGFNTDCPISISFTDAGGSKTWLANLPPESTFKMRTSVPNGSAPGAGAFSAQQGAPGYPYYCGRAIPVSAEFTVTP
jgi:hypothetical protein